MVRKAIIAVLFIVLTVAILGCTPQAQPAETQEQIIAPEEHDTMVMDEEAPVAPITDEPSPDARVIRLSGENFKFVADGVDNPDIVVKQGELIRIEFTSTSGFHDWVVDEFAAATERVRDGGSTFVEFTADQAGTFEYYCSVGQHRANGMKGKLIVE